MKRAAAAAADRVDLFKAIMLEVISFLPLSFFSFGDSSKPRLSACRRRQWGETGRARLQETRGGTMLMIKDQLIRHLLCNLK